MLSHDELFRIIQACKPSQDLAIVLLLAPTRLRASKCGALKLKDVNFERQELTIREAKWDKSRALGIHQDVMAVLRRYLEDRPDVACDYFFLNRLHQKIVRCGIRQRVERLEKKVGVVASPHMFQRYFATSHLLNGRSIKEVQTGLRHSTPDMTLKYDRTAKEQVTESMKNWQTLSSLPQSPLDGGRMWLSGCMATSTTAVIM